MLPFHLKVTSKKGAKNEKNDIETSSLPPEEIHPFYDGGPLQRAIRSDLQALYEGFAGRIQVAGFVISSTAGAAAANNHHLQLGFAFQQFRETTAKLALLHTRFCPPRINENAYSQLLYASCLSLLKDAFQQQQQGPNVTLGVFAVFALYALFETNPLPTSPTTAKEQQQLGMLPMGLINKDKNTATFFHAYRRSFRQPIRIDQEHYGYLIQLRDLALAVKALCEHGRMKQRQKLLFQQTKNNENGDDDDVSSTASSVAAGTTTTTTTETWTCTCCAASDVPSVISRLVPNLEFCAYTGPCGLEALAGHANYSYPPTIQAYQLLQETRQGQKTAAAEDDVVIDMMDSSVAATEQYTLPEELDKKLDDYLLNKQSIRVPAASIKTTQKTKRAREAIMPMFASSRIGKDLLVDLSDRCKEGDQQLFHQIHQQHHVTKRVRVRHQPSTFGAVIVPDASTVGQSVQSFVEKRTNVEEEEEGGEAVLDLVLPTDLPPELEESLKSAVETLVERDEYLSLPLQEVVNENNGGPAGLDISTLGGRGASVATDVGRNALNALLARATNGSVLGHASMASSTTGIGRNALKNLLATATGGETANNESFEHMSALEARQGELFLGVSAFEDEGTEAESKAQQEETSYMSDLSSDEDRSITGSTVGRTALRDLLSIAEHYQHGPRKQKIDSTERRKRPARPKKRQASNRQAVGNKRALSDPESSKDEGSSSSESEGQQTQGDDSRSSGARGRLALNALLRQAAVRPQDK